MNSWQISTRFALSRASQTKAGHYKTRQMKNGTSSLCGISPVIMGFCKKHKSHANTCLDSILIHEKGGQSFNGPSRRLIQPATRPPRVTIFVAATTRIAGMVGGWWGWRGRCSCRREGGRSGVGWGSEVEHERDVFCGEFAHGIAEVEIGGFVHAVEVGTE